jgi:hypothetical protein
MYTMFTHSKVPSSTRTIRIKKESDLVLEREAQRHGISVNALISNLIDHYVYSLRFFTSGGMLSINNETLMSLVEHLSNEQIADTAYARGDQKVRESLMQRGMLVNYDSVLWYIQQILGGYNGWFRCDHIIEEKMERLHLSHNYGFKWSIFIMNYIASMLKEVIGLKINTVMLKNAVNIEISK